MKGRALLMLGAGFTVWALAFVVLYAMLSVGCRFGWDDIELAGGVSVQRAQLVILLLLHLMACLALRLSLGAPRRHSFLHTTARWATNAATAAMIFVFLPVFALSACH